MSNIKIITNNTFLFEKIHECGEFVDGSSLDVLIRVRDFVHTGSVILTHPLCGNLRPNHQPFRSVIIDEKKGSVDLGSLSLIEEAVSVYQSSKIVTQKEIDELTLKDYAYVDFQLMRESFLESGIKF